MDAEKRARECKTTVKMMLMACFAITIIAASAFAAVVMLGIPIFQNINAPENAVELSYIQGLPDYTARDVPYDVTVQVVGYAMVRDMWIVYEVNGENMSNADVSLEYYDGTAWCNVSMYSTVTCISGEFMPPVSSFGVGYVGTVLMRVTIHTPGSYSTELYPMFVE